MNTNKNKLFYLWSFFMVLMVLSCRNPVLPSILPDSDDKIATVKTYIIAYYANGGEGEMEASVFTVDKWEDLPPNNFSFKNKIFIGWASIAEGDVEYADKASVKNIADAGKTFILHAKWGTDVF